MKRRILHDAEGDLQNKRVRKSALPVRVGETVVEIPVELWLRYAPPCVEPGIGRYILSDRYHQLRQVVGTTLWRHRDAFGGYHGGKLGLGRVEQLQERLVGSWPHCAPPQCGVCLSMQTAAAVFEDAALFSVIKQALRAATLPLSDKQVGLPHRVYCSDRDIELELTTEIPYSHDGYRGTLTAADREVISAAEPNRDHWVVRRMRQVQLVLAEERRRRWAVQRATLLPQLPTVIIHMIVDYVHARPPSPIDDLKVWGCAALRCATLTSRARARARARPLPLPPCRKRLPRPPD